MSPLPVRVTTIQQSSHKTSVNYSFHTICTTFSTVMTESEMHVRAPIRHARREGPAGRDRYGLSLGRMVQDRLQCPLEGKG